MYQQSNNGWIKHVDFFIVDALTQHLVLILIYGIRFEAWLYTDSNYCRLAVLLAICDLLSILVFNTLHNVLKRGYYVEFRETVRHCFFVYVLVILFLVYMQERENYSGTIIFSVMLFHVFLGYCTRVFWKWFIKNIRISILEKKKILVLLESETADQNIKNINHNLAANYEIEGIILDKKTDLTTINNVPVVACVEEAAEYICQNPVDSVYVDCSLTDQNVADFLDDCLLMAIPVHYRVPELFGKDVYRFVEKIGDETVLTSSINYATPREQFAKRLLDIVGGLVGSVITLLLILIIGPMIKKASPGPVLFAQERVGFNGRRFKMYKLRSMYPDADRRKKELMEQNSITDSRMFKMENDPRIIGNKILPDGTCKKGIGDFIRRTSLDEFPQFFNVLIGQMSLVGTRPPTVDEWEQYEYHHRARLACKPGITGLWQVSGRSNIKDFEEVVKLDTQYIANWSFGMDLRILFKTFFVVFGKHGAM